MEKKTLPKQLVAILDDEGNLERAYAVVQNVVVEDGKITMREGTREDEATPEQIQAIFGAAEAATRKDLATALSTVAERDNTIKALEAKLEQIRAIAA